MTGSPAEREIRDAVVASVRPRLPGARMIHELTHGRPYRNGHHRADIVAVTRDRLIVFEIKSERDKLDRLDDQIKVFTRSSHSMIVVAHNRWLDPTHKPDDWNIFNIFNYALGGSPAPCQAALWAYPEPDDFPVSRFKWKLPIPSLIQPRATFLLSFLQKEELAAEAARHRIGVGRGATMPDIMEQMAWLMTGREIAEAVCRQLRMRAFPEADAPIAEVREAAG